MEEIPVVFILNQGVKKSSREAISTFCEEQKQFRSDTGEHREKNADMQGKKENNRRLSWRVEYLSTFAHVRMCT